MRGVQRRGLAMGVVLALAATSLARAAVVDSPLPTFSDGKASVAVLVVPGAVKRGRLQTDVICTSRAGVAVDVGIEIFDSAGLRLNDVAAGVGAVLDVAPGQTVTVGTSTTLGFLETTIVPLAAVEQGAVRVVASAAAVDCIAVIADDAVTPPTSLATLGAGVDLGPGPALLGAPLPAFSDGQSATHAAIFPGLVKRGRMETVIFCTSLAPLPLDIGVQVFGPDGVLQNDVAAGDGALLQVAPGATATFGTTGTLAYLESTVITLAGVAQGVARVVASGGGVRCAAQVVDSALVPPAAMSELAGYAPAALAPTATPTATPSATASATATRTATRTATSTGTRTATATATRTLAGIGVPVITAPLAGQVIGVEGVTFTWTQVAGVTGYDLRIVNPTTQAVLFSGSLVGATSTSSIISLPSNGSYTFRVRACVGSFSDATCGGFASRTFSVALVTPSAAPAVTVPAPGARLTLSRQTLAWTTVTGNPALPDLFYEVRLLNLGNGQTELALRTFHPSTTTPAVLRSGSYRLQVRACQAGCGPYSAPIDFTVALGPVPSAAPTLLGAAVSGGNTMNASWTAVAGAEWYQVQVVQPPPAGPGGGALTVASRQVVGATATGNIPVPVGQAFVIVAACNGDGCGPYSGGASISPAGPNPALPNVGEPIGDSVVNGPSVLFAWNRIPGDTGGDTLYRVYVQDLSRQTAALDVLTTQNYYGALLKAEGAKYALVVIANPGTASQVQGPGSAFTVRGSSAVAPTLIAPTHGSRVTAGNVLFAWSPVPGATLYEYYVAVQGVSAATGRGVTPGLFVQVPLAPVSGQATVYSGIVRACPAGASCVGGSNLGWGPWSNVAGTGGVSVTVLP